MDELEISGKRYISTRRAAREHGYHSDYMGQLIRGKKVSGQKVGRAWYIEEDSLNVYLGKQPAAVSAASKVASVQEVSMPAPVERLVVEEVVPVAIPEVLHARTIVEPEATPEPIIEAIKEKEFIRQEVQPIAQPIVQPVQEIHHAPYIEEKETRIPIHTQPATSQEVGGLRYAPDDSPSIPLIVRMPQPPMYAHAQASYEPGKHVSAGKFPFVSLSAIGIMAIVAAMFASNFISATIVADEGKAATVQYAIHW